MASGEFDLASNRYFSGVLEDIGIATDDQCAIAAFWDLYQLTIAEYTQTKNPVTARTIAASDVLKKVKTRYDLLSQYEKHFYSHTHSYDRSALVYALILDGLINEINDDQEKPFLKVAKAIWKQSVDFEENGYKPEPDEIPEAVFLAYVNMMEKLSLAEKNLDELNADDIRKFVIDKIPKIKEHEQSYSAFGLDLAQQAFIVEKRLLIRLRKLTPKPELTLVVDNTVRPAPSP